MPRVSKDNFDDLIKCYQQKLKSFLYRFTASIEDAEDLAQETFAKAFEKLHLFKGESSFKTWLFAMRPILLKIFCTDRRDGRENSQDKCQYFIGTTPGLQAKLKHIASHSETGKYDLKEYIDLHGTC